MRKLSKILALALVLIMMFAVVSAFSVTTSAAQPEYLYLTPNANWKVDGARFAAYFFGNGDTWVSMTDSNGDGIYEVKVPTDKTYPSVIFCRMNPNASANNWNNKWNQTADLTIPTGGANHYTVKESTWDKGGGTWSTFGSSCSHANKGPAATCTTAQECLDCGDPVVSALGHSYNSSHKCTRCGNQATFVIAGNGAHLGGDFNPSLTANNMTYDEATGTYTKVYTNVAAGSYKFKCVRDNDTGWGTAYPGSDKTYSVATAGSTVTMTLKGTTVTVTVVAPHTHSFSDPTCTEPGKCSCGDTQGEALGHDMVAGEVVAPTFTAGGYTVYTCANGCGLTENRDATPVRVLPGAGTEEDPYVIDSLEALIAFRDSVNAGETKYNAEGVYVALGADIDMAEVDWSVNIGDNANATFDGIFDGQGHKILNLNSTETAQSGDGYVCTGLFGAIYGNAVIKNLTIENVSINTGDFTGNNVAAVVGFIWQGKGSIENVTVCGKIEINAPGIYGVGAIVGYSYSSNITVVDCKVVGAEGSYIKAISGAGAIAGYSDGIHVVGAEVSGLSIEGAGLVGGIFGIALGSDVNGATLSNVALTATKAEWVNGTGIAAGTIASKITVAGVVAENVTGADTLVGSKYTEKPTTVVPAIEARIGDTYYQTLQEALNAANGGTVVVLRDIALNSTLVLDGKNATLDLDGHTIDAAFEAEIVEVLLVKNGATLTITGNGTMLATGEGEHVEVISAIDGGKVTIENGTFVSNGCTAIYATRGGIVTINGGRYEAKELYNGMDFTLDINEAEENVGIIVVNGGSFVRFNPANHNNDGVNSNKLAEGLHAIAAEGVYTVGAHVWADATFEAPKTCSVCGATEGVAIVAVAEIGGVKYTSLQEALNVGGEVVLLTDIGLTDNKGLSVPAGVVVVLDLNGHVLGSNAAEAATSAVIVNRGTLTIKDSVGGGKITTAAVNPDLQAIPGYASNTITNYGVLVLESGIIENTVNAGAAYAVDNSSNGVTATFTMNGGKLVATRCALRMFCNSAVYENNVTINGGEIVGGTRAIWIHLPGADSTKAANGNLTINGGTLNGGSGQSLYVYTYGNNHTGTFVTITGGTFLNDVLFGGGTYKETQETVSITGGTFNGYLGRYLANDGWEDITGDEGYHFVDGVIGAHTWTDATCTAPQICVCGATQGTALGHTWVYATCTTPDTCSVCGLTEGEARGHADANPCDHECDWCGASVSDCLDENNDHDCDICGDVMSACADADKDHFCDICGVQNSHCIDIPPYDHNCDWCGVKMSEHNYVDGICGICGAEDPNYVPPHVHAHEAVVTAPTCTAAGYTTYTCECGDTYVADEVPATGHAYENCVCTGCGTVLPTLSATDSFDFSTQANFDAVVAGGKLGFVGTFRDNGGSFQFNTNSTIQFIAPANSTVTIVGHSAQYGVFNVYLNGVETKMEGSLTFTVTEETKVVIATGDNGASYSYIKSISLAEYVDRTISADTTITFGSEGNYKGSIVDFSGIQIGDNGGNNSQVKNGSFDLLLKAGSKVVIHGYPGYTSYKLNDGEPIEDEYYTFIALEDMVLTVTPVSGNNYFYSIEVTLHTGLTLVDAKDPTCTEAGYNAHYVCDCHGELTDKGEIAVLAHDYKYDVCSGCGAIDPAYADVTHRINFSTWEKFDKETYADGTVVKYNDIFSFIYSKNAKVDESSKTWDDFAGTLRFSFGSKTPTGKIPNKAAMQITVDGAYTIKLWYVAGGDARYFALLDSTGAVISETTKDTVKNDQYYAELIIPAAGTYYLGTPADNNYLFQIELVKHEHTAGAEATCTTAQTCTTCGAVLVAALGHDYEASVTAPTCTEAGYTTYTCACGDTYTGDEVAALGHNYEAVVTAPTCTEAGYTTYTCACGDTYTEVGEAALGHTAGAEATCTTAQTCTTCGAELVAALGHVEHALAMVAPTCTETGLTRGSQCLECGEILAAQEEIPATGHTFVEGKCECGAEDPDYVPEQSSVEEPSIFATIWAKIVAFFASIIGFFKNLFA